MLSSYHAAEHIVTSHERAGGSLAQLQLHSEGASLFHSDESHSRAQLHNKNWALYSRAQLHNKNWALYSRTQLHNKNWALYSRTQLHYPNISTTPSPHDTEGWCAEWRGCTSALPRPSAHRPTSSRFRGYPASVATPAPWLPRNI